MRTCDNCGAENPDYVPYCGRCGHELVKGSGKGPPGGQLSHASLTPSRTKIQLSPIPTKCNWCGKMTDSGRPCYYCGKDPASERPTGIGRRTDTPIVGGACAIAAGGLAIVQGLSFLAGEAIFLSITGSLTWFLAALGIAEIALGALSIRAGLLARRRENYHFALVGSIMGMVAVGLGLGAFLGLVAVILIAMSEEEFHG